MRALLVYYMTTQLLFGQEKSSSIYGFYTAFAYFTPIIGGTIADRWLGKRRAVIIGATVMAAGHFMMASEPLFYVALATIAIGNGLFLPTLPSQINDLYTRRRPAPAVGLQRLLCRRERRRVPRAARVRVPRRDLRLALRLRRGRRRHARRPRHLSLRSGVSAAANGPSTRSGARHRPRIAAATPSCCCSASALQSPSSARAYEQIGNTIALWMRDDVNRVIGGVEIGAAMFFSLNPLLVMVLTPLLLARWRRQAERGRELSVIQKMAVGALLVAASYLLVAAAEAMAGGGRAHWVWLLSYFFVFTLGELFILPNGLGIFARLAPPKLGASTVAAWYLAIFSGSLAAGQVGRLWSHVGHVPFFVILAGIATLSAGLLYLLEVAHAEDPRARRRGRAAQRPDRRSRGFGEAEQCVNRQQFPLVSRAIAWACDSIMISRGEDK